jgi:hypothetical protein
LLMQGHGDVSANHQPMPAPPAVLPYIWAYPTA